MLNKQENLLTHLAEECAEVTQRVSKILRFGIDEVQPEQGLSNRQRLINELQDLIGVIDYLIDENIIDEQVYNAQTSNAKKVKINKYLGYSQERGTLCNN